MRTNRRRVNPFVEIPLALMVLIMVLPIAWMLVLSVQPDW
jgi:ABC-type glycerol-3-phosphate transport system permease component